MKRTVVTFAALVVLAGCGGGSSDSGVKKAVTAYSDAYLGGHGSQAYALLSERCRRQVTPAEMDSLTKAAQSLYGQLPIRTFKADVSGSSASVTYTYTVAKLDQSGQHWTDEGGWKWDAC